MTALSPSTARTIQFTGDTCATWPMLAFEAELSAEEGNVGMTYVSHDIGSYNGVPGDLPCGTSDYQVTPAAIASRVLPGDLYARWVQLGTFQPLDRLHSNHGDRLPWEYGPAADAVGHELPRNFVRRSTRTSTRSPGARMPPGYRSPAGCTCSGPVSRPHTSIRPSTPSVRTWSSRPSPRLATRPP